MILIIVLLEDTVHEQSHQMNVGFILSDRQPLIRGGSVRQSVIQLVRIERKIQVFSIENPEFSPQREHSQCPTGCVTPKWLYTNYRPPSMRTRSLVNI